MVALFELPSLLAPCSLAGAASPCSRGVLYTLGMCAVQ